MIYRMAEYSIMLMRKYKLAIQQYVIYLRETKPKMPTFLDTAHHKFNFNLIRISELDYKMFLKSNSPEFKMLGILANFGKEDSEAVASSIVTGISSTDANKFEQLKHFEQLRIYGKLRKSIESQIVKAMQSVSTFFKEEEDFLFQKGEAVGQTKGEVIGQRRGEQKKTRAVIVNLITKFGFSDIQAAEIAEVDVDYVINVRAELNK